MCAFDTPIKLGSVITTDAEDKPPGEKGNYNDRGITAESFQNIILPRRGFNIALKVDNEENESACFNGAMRILSRVNIGYIINNNYVRAIFR